MYSDLKLVFAYELRIFSGGSECVYSFPVLDGFWVVRYVSHGNVLVAFGCLESEAHD